MTDEPQSNPSTIRRGSARGRLRRAAYVLALLQTVALVAAAAASADYHVEVCSDLSTAAASGSSGWTTSSSGSAINTSLCNSGGYTDLMFDSGVNHNPNNYATATFTAPANTTISAFSLWRWGTVGPAVANAAPVAQVLYDGNAVDMCAQASGCSQEGSTTSSNGSVVGTSDISARQIVATVACKGVPGVCANASELRIYGGDIDLSQSTSPTVTSASGSLTAQGTLSGLKNLSYSATDNGSGVYQVKLLVDGTVVATQVPNSNGGQCAPTRQNADGSLVFNTVVPCAASVSGSMLYDTALLTDGTHAVQLVVTDAAGNSTVAFDDAMTTQNAPSAAAEPLVDGSARVGQALTGSDTTFTSPSTAGDADVSHTFVRCDAQGANCEPIAGATGATYTLIWKGVCQGGRRLLARVAVGRLWLGVWVAAGAARALQADMRGLATSRRASSRWGRCLTSSAPTGVGRCS